MQANDGIIRKRCSKCGQLIPLLGFYKNRATPDRLSYQCINCHSLANIERRHVEDPDWSPGDKYDHEWAKRWSWRFDDAFSRGRSIVWAWQGEEYYRLIVGNLPGVDGIGGEAIESFRRFGVEWTQSRFFLRKMESHDTRRLRKRKRERLMRNGCDAIPHYREINGSKQCSRCTKTKLIKDFYMRGDGHGHRQPCKQCQQAQYDERKERMRCARPLSDAQRATKNRLNTREWLAIIESQGNRCAYCGKDMMPPTVDHVLAVMHGGQHTASNVVAACLSCNARKGNRPAVPLAEIVGLGRIEGELKPNIEAAMAQSMANVG